MRGILKKIRRAVAFTLVVVLTALLMPAEYLSGLFTESFPGNVKAEVTLSNPRIVKDSSMEAGQKVTWDCIWFGNYPQTEIVNQASTCGTYRKVWGKESDYEVNVSLYNTLQNTTGWDSNGDVVVDGKKYRRLKKDDATYSSGDGDSFYSWSDSTSYHYFRYDPIKWRVLAVSEGKAFLLADKTLDTQFYYIFEASVTWETSTIRSWMNGYSVPDIVAGIVPGIDYSSNNFINNAFSSEEQNAIFITNVVNDDNIDYGTEGGNNTNDKIFLLSESEVYNTQIANSYGFVTDSSTYDEARRSKSSTYAKAMGVLTQSLLSTGNCRWYLRSPGNNSGGVMRSININYDGDTGNHICNISSGVRPALNLNLSSSTWSYAGTVCSDGSSNEQAAPEYGSGGDSELVSNTSKYSLSDTYSFTNGKASGRIGLNMLNKFFKPLTAYSLWSKKIGVDGVCYGMAVSAMASSVYDSPIASSYGKNRLYDVTTNTISTDTRISAKEYVQYAFVSQYTEQSQKERQDLGKSDLNGLYKAVEDNILNNGEPVSIAIRGDKNNYGHRLWAIGVGENNSEKTEIKVYDCNHPGENCYLMLKKENGNYTSWEYTLKSGMVWGTGRVNASILYYNPAESFVEQYGGIKNYIPQIGESRPLLTIDNTTSKILTTKGEETEISPDMEDERFLYIQTDDVVIDSEPTERKSYSYWADLPDKMTVISTEDTSCNVSAGESALKLDMPAGAEAELSVSDTGNNSADINKIGKEDFEISYFNAENEGGIDQVTFSSEGQGQIQSIQTEEGIEISSDNLSGLKVSRTEIDKDGNNVKLAETVVPANIQNILVQDNDDALLIKEDSDNDGNYDDIVTQIPYQKKTEEETKKPTTPVNTVSDSKVFVSKINLKGISHNISSGKKITLKADVTPANATIKKLIWTSSNPKVATVNQAGVVTVKKKTGGKSVTITATAADGSGISASWKIKSMKGVVKKIAVSGAKAVKAGKSLKLKAKVTATKGANKKPQWTSSNTKYATVTSSGKVKTFKAGKGKKVKITAMATDGSGKKKSVIIKIK